MAAHHNLQQVFIHLHYCLGEAIIIHEEDDGEERELKLRADADEGAAQRLHQTLPAELQVHNMVIRAWLKGPNTNRNITCQ